MLFSVCFVPVVEGIGCSGSISCLSSSCNFHHNVNVKFKARVLIYCRLVHSSLDIVHMLNTHYFYAINIFAR